MAGFGGWLRGAGLRLADHFVSGNNYDRNTGQWSATPGQYVTGIGGKLAGLFNPLLGLGISKGADYFYNHQGNPGGPTQGQIPLTPNFNVNDLGGGLGFNSGSLGFPSSYNPFSIPTTGSPYDALGGGANPMDPTGTFTGNPGYAGGGGSSGYTGNGGMNWAQNAGGGASMGGSGSGIGFGWTGISGDAARGMFQGMSSASNDAVQAEALAQMRKLRQ